MMTNESPERRAEEPSEPLPLDVRDSMDRMATTLRTICQRVLKRQEVDLRRSFFELGGNSFTFIHFVAAVQRELDIRLTAEALLQCRALLDVVTLLQRHGLHGPAPADDRAASTDIQLVERAPGDELAALEHIVAPRQGVVTGPVEILANRYAIFYPKRRELHYWNVTAALELRDPVDLSALAKAAHHLITYHDGLRLQTQGEGADWSEWIVEPAACQPLVVRRHEGDGSALGPSEDAWQRFVEKECEDLSHGFTFPGELFKILCVEHALSRQCVLFLVAHHLLLDGYSAALVRRDLLHLYGAYTRSLDPPQLPHKTTSLIDYSTAIRRHWLDRAEQELDYWRSLPWQQLRPLPVDFGSPEDINIEKYTNLVIRSVPVADSEEFVARFARGGRHTFVEVMLSAIARAYHAWTGHDVLHMATAFHSRSAIIPGMDLTRTVGWLTDVVPLLLPGHQATEPLLREVRRQNAYANVRGKSYGVLKYIACHRELVEHPSAPLSLNILLPGRNAPLDSDLARSSTRFDQPAAPKAATQRPFLMSGGVYFRSNRLYVSWDFSTRLFSTDRIEAFVELCVQEFQHITSQVGCS